MKTTQDTTVENNRLITEFMGYKLKPCNNGLAWERPTLSSIHDNFNLHRRLYRKEDSYYKFYSSWDWLMPVVEKCVSTGDNTYRWDDIFTALETLKIKEVYEEVVNFIKWYNLNKED